jgi:hypothetical protein
MANNKKADDFEKIIHAGKSSAASVQGVWKSSDWWLTELKARDRKKNESLAAKIFGKDRRTSAPPTKPALGGSLASRVGVKKVGRSRGRPM